MKKSFYILGLAIGLFSTSAYSSFIADLGQGASGYQGVTTNLSPGSYNDYYTFTTDVATNFVPFSFTVGGNNATWFQAGSISFNLYEDQTTPAGTPVASSVSGGGVGSLNFIASLDTDTNYVLETRYSFNLIGGEGYNMLSVGIFGDPTPTPPPPVSAVPLPAAAWLFASGLIGLVAAKKKGSGKKKKPYSK